ncbi:AtpZ/AtpI family protein [Anaeroselena agilis]|uniref:AtpZ/AtpI family protein n=1 Tax=Anaeroselena agilis TaxID=3063788 RepID=A0ABU3P3Y3_9FIRM|nr:AtpZ/AtpI family protein [Selenomonadales bacterium 4137-cl]
MKRDDRRQLMAAFGMVGNVGIGMVASAAVGLIGGRFIDNWLDSSPWATVIGTLLGLIAGLWSAYKRVASDE